MLLVADELVLSCLVSPGAHFIGSWLVASATSKNPRDRNLITLAGVAPDLDGLGMAVDIFKSWVSGEPNLFNYYHKFHHLLCHGWPAALVLCGLLACFAKQRTRVFVVCLVTFHLHLLCDLLGSRGPTPADLWPILYGEPLFRHPIWTWHNQWRLDGWQNQILFVLMFGTALWRSVRLGHSFLEMFGYRVDLVFVQVLQKWAEKLQSPTPPAA